jgi:RHS repeat-associated protein
MRRGWRALRRRHECIDEAIASICESLERRRLMSDPTALPLEWKWNANFTDSVGTWSGTTQDRRVLVGSPPTGSQAISPRDSYLTGPSLTISGTNLQHMSSGEYDFTTSLLLIDNAGTNVTWAITITSTDKSGSTVTTTANGDLKEEVAIGTAADADLEWTIGHTCWNSAPDYAYVIRAHFPNYATNTVNVSIQVGGLQNVHLDPTAWASQPPSASWGIDDASITGISSCACSVVNGDTGTMQYTPAGGESSDADGEPLDDNTTWGNGPQFASGNSANGNNTINGAAPSLVANGSSSVLAVGGRGGVRGFDGVSGTSSTVYVSRSGLSDTLTHDNTSHIFTLTDSDGTQSIYYDFSTNVTSGLQGKIEYMINPSGSSATTVSTYAYDGNNRLQTITRSSTDSGGTSYSEQFSYTYIASGCNAGKIDNVLLQRKVGAGSYAGWRETKYRYYDGSAIASTNAASIAYGNAGDLMSEQLLDATTTNLAVISTSYMRYFTPNGTGTNGYTGALEYVVGPGSYARMVTNGAGYDPLAGAVSDSTIASYADDAFQYDLVTHQVTQHVVQGEGASGLGTHTYSYGWYHGTNTISVGDGHGAAWGARLDETLPDGTIDRTYFDANGEPLLQITIDANGNQWGTYYMRDSAGRVRATFNPSTLTLPNQSTLESYPDLLNFQNGRSSYLNLTSGRVDYTDYYSKTDSNIDDSTPGGPTPGGVIGFTQDEGVGRGELSIPVTVSSVSHTSSTVFIATAANHGYRNGDIVVIAGADVPDYNGTQVISNVTSNSFEFTLGSTPPTNSAGANITAVELPILTSKFTYFSHNDGVGDFVYPAATETRYRNADGTGAEVTTHSYDWYSNSLQMLRQTIIQPPITSSQNGPASDTNDTGNADTAITYYDIYGRPAWIKDGDGYISYTEYDPKTGAVSKSIADVNTTNTADFSSLPSGWTSTNHSALRLITTYTNDGHGRPTEVTGPGGTGHNLIVSTYDDVNHETRTYHGYMSGSNFVEVGPTQVHREDQAGSYTEDLTLVATPNLTGGLPDGTEPITTSGIRSLTRTHTTSGEQVDETDRYFTFTSGTNTLSYSTGAASFQLGGTSGANVYYYATQYGYDAAGRQNRVVNPVGTIARTVYDTLGRQTSQWVGTNDTVSGTWSPTNAGGMTKISAYFYDTYDPTVTGIGDGNLTRVVQYPNGTSASTLQVTENFYDWRDRQVASKSGVLLDSNDRFANTSGETGQSGTNVVHRPISYYTYDNLDEVMQTDQYDGDGVSLSGTNGVVVDSDADGVPDAPSSSHLWARTTQSYDDQGRVYKTSVFSVTPNGTNPATVSSNSLDTKTFYDHRGNAMAVFQPGGLTSKFVYDGAGRLTKQYSTDGGVMNLGSSAANNWSNAASVANDVVLQQIENQYDADGNVVLVTTRQRYHNDATNGAGLGDLRDPSNNPKARVSFESFYYDQADRQTDSVDWGTLSGTNGSGVSMIGLGSAPARSGTALVTTFGYSADAIETVTITGAPTGGTFTLTYNGSTTTSIAYNASASTVQSALTSLSGMSGNFSVIGVNGGPYTIRFIGALGEKAPANTITASGTNLTGGVATARGAIAVMTTPGGDAGLVQKTVDPRGLINKTDYDLAGRAVDTFSAFSNGVPTSSTDQLTAYTYDGDDHVLTQKAVLSNVGTNQVFQTTQYVYGVTTSTSGINSNDLLLQVEYPDKSTGSPNTNSAYVESYTYDALGEQTKKTQRTGSVHQYSYDPLGRMTSDNVITLGGAVNGSIRRIDYTFDTGGRLYQATSFSNTSGATIVNQIQRDYNGLGQVVTEWQSQTGGVNTSPGTNQTTSVQYTYSELANGTNYANHSRLTSIIYPEGDRTVNYAYNGNSGLDDVISRLSALTQTVGTNTTTLESYDYLGIGTVVAKHHPQNGIDVTYEQQTNDTNAPATNDGGDIYTGLDRFGRIADQNWLNTNSGTSLTSTDRFQYGYDADSNVMYKKNKVSSSNSELYHTNGTNGAYDSLNRLTAFSRGTLNAGNDTITGASATRSWTLDALGNWSANPSGDTYAVNDENQYTSLTHVTGGCCGGSSSLNFTYDNDGNLTTRVDSIGFSTTGYVADTFAYDAWDRLASMTHTIPNGGGVSWTETDFDIDGLGRRDQVVVTENNCTAVPSDNLFYSIDWQVLEDDRATSVNNGVATGWTRNQYVWSPTYVNDLVLRQKDTNHDNGFAERLYVEQDANHNVTAITDTSGNVKERFVYDPYGAQTVLNSSWAGTSDTYTWIYGFQGGRYDSYAGLYNFQRREYDPTLGRWMQQDPAGYVDGKNLYRALTDSPVDFVDPLGLQTQPAGGGLPTPQPAGFNLYSNTPATATTLPGTLGLTDWKSTLQKWGDRLSADDWSKRSAAQSDLEDLLESSSTARRVAQAALDQLQQMQRNGTSPYPPEVESRLNDALNGAHIRIIPDRPVTIVLGNPATNPARLTVHTYVPPHTVPGPAAMYYIRMVSSNVDIVRVDPANTIALTPRKVNGDRKVTVTGLKPGTESVTAELYVLRPNARQYEFLAQSNAIPVCVK